MSYNGLCSNRTNFASYMKIKIGANRDGHITAMQGSLAYAAGAYPGSPVDAGAGVLFAPYRTDNLLIDTYDVLVNKPRTQAYRAPGGTNAAFACETVVDEICEKLGMDPLEFRLLNGIKEGDRRHDNTRFPRIGCLETVQAAKDHPHYRAPLSGANRGRGVASGYWGNYGGKSSAACSVNADGTVSLVVGSVDIGGTRTSLSMQLAEALGISDREVKPMVGDTDAVGFTEGTYGSRTTFATGWAVYELAQKLKKEMVERAAEYWEVLPEAVNFSDGVFSTDGKHMTFKELAGIVDEGRPISASASVLPEREGPAFATHIVDVEVDPETGKVDILRYTAVQDVGTAIHPSYVEGQIQGGVTQGIGWGLNEEYVYDEQGHLLNASLLDYREPTALDLPMIEPVLVEVPNPGHP
jgi:CO/xanthine dehydrogenase Mo-binding subunit